MKKLLPFLVLAAILVAGAVSAQSPPYADYGRLTAMLAMPIVPMPLDLTALQPEANFNDMHPSTTAPAPTILSIRLSAKRTDNPNYSLLIWTARGAPPTAALLATNLLCGEKSFDDATQTTTRDQKRELLKVSLRPAALPAELNAQMQQTTVLDFNILLTAMFDNRARVPKPDHI